MHDRFHVPYPASADQFLVSRSSTSVLPESMQSSNDRMMALPVEVFDEIFMSLSAPTLDAARFVCKAWWYRIMNNLWVLCHVLKTDEEAVVDGIVGVKHFVNPNTRAECLRRLAQRLDFETNPTRIYAHPDAWRIRYIQYNFDFKLPIRNVDENQLSNSVKPFSICMADFDAASNIAAFIVRVDDSVFDSMTHVAIYQCSRKDRPFLIGMWQCLNLVSPLHLRSYKAVEGPDSWVTEVIFSNGIMKIPIGKHGGSAKDDNSSSFQTEVCIDYCGQHVNIDKYREEAIQ